MSNREPHHKVVISEYGNDNELIPMASFVISNFAKDDYLSRHEQTVQVIDQLIDPTKPAADQVITTRRLRHEELKSELGKCKEPEEVANGLVVSEQMTSEEIRARSLAVLMLVMRLRDTEPVKI